MRPKEHQQTDVESANCIRFKHSDGHGLNTFAGKRHTVLKMFPVSLQYVSGNFCQHWSTARVLSGSSWQMKVRGC